MLEQILKASKPGLGFRDVAAPQRQADKIERFMHVSRLTKAHAVPRGSGVFEDQQSVTGGKKGRRTRASQKEACWPG